MPQDERATGVRVGTGVVEGGVEPMACLGQGGGEASAGRDLAAVRLLGTALGDSGSGPKSTCGTLGPK